MGTCLYIDHTAATHHVHSTVVNSGGWGNGFCASLVSGTPCINNAVNGATTGSAFASGTFNKTLAYIKSEVAKGRRTLVTIQYGHNDMKIVSFVTC
jgi:lysophospholipase L1-like esterase